VHDGAGGQAARHEPDALIGAGGLIRPRPPSRPPHPLHTQPNPTQPNPPEPRLSCSPVAANTNYILLFASVGEGGRGGGEGRGGEGRGVRGVQ